MVPLRNEKQLAAVNEDSQEEHPVDNLPRDMIVPRINKDDITQVSEDIERALTEKLSQEFTTTEIQI